VKNFFPQRFTASYHLNCNTFSIQKQALSNVLSGKVLIAFYGLKKYQHELSTLWIKTTFFLSIENQLIANFINIVWKTYCLKSKKHPTFATALIGTPTPKNPPCLTYRPSALIELAAPVLPIAGRQCFAASLSFGQLCGLGIIALHLRLRLCRQIGCEK